MKRYEFETDFDSSQCRPIETTDGDYVKFDGLGPQLTPEHRERIRRIAIATGRTEGQVLADAVTEYLVRIASRKGLGPGQW